MFPEQIEMEAIEAATETSLTEMDVLNPIPSESAATETEEDSASEPETPPADTVVVTSWATLDSAWQDQTVTAGDEVRLHLPETLVGQTAQGGTAVVSVSWQGAKEASEPGEYTLTPQLPYGYEADLTTETPQIRLTVLPAQIDEGLFSYEGLNYRLEENELVLLGGDLPAGEAIIPQEVTYADGESYPVGRVESNAFKKSGQVSSLTLPASLKNTGENAFANCDDLKELTLAPGISSISQGSFRGCSALEKVTIPSTVTAMGARAFENCEKLNEVDLPHSVSVIGPGAFENCKQLETITIRGKLENVGANAFEGCAEGLRFTVYASETAGMLMKHGVSAERITLR